MLELICQQRYRANGVPTDISPYRNHGTAIQTSPAPGMQTNTTAIQFPKTASIVRIDANAKQGWAPLQEVKVEVVARLAPHAQRTQCLVIGDGSFEFAVFEGAISVLLPGPSGTATNVRSDESFSPDHKFHVVPDQRWTTLGFHHDGFSRCRLFMDGVLVGETKVLSGVPGILSGAVWIGNRVSGGAPLQGNIEEVKIWRSDPNFIRREFLCRPYTPKTAACWEAIFRKLQEWTVHHPSEAAAAFNAIEAGETVFMHTLLDLSPSEQEKMRIAVLNILHLWCIGMIHGREMEHALRHWIELLHASGFDLAGPPQFVEIQDLFENNGFRRSDVDIKCDPAMEAFLAIVEREVAAVAGEHK